MAELFLAQQSGIVAGFEKTLVIKRLLPIFSTQEDVIRMFLNEARLAALLSHPNIVQIYDLGQQDEHYYIAMEYVEGTTLKEILRRKGAIAPAGVLHVLMQIAEARPSPLGPGERHRQHGMTKFGVRVESATPLVVL